MPLDTIDTLHTLRHIQACVDHAAATLQAARTHGTYLYIYRDEAIRTAHDAISSMTYLLAELIAQAQEQAEIEAEPPSKPHPFIAAALEALDELRTKDLETLARLRAQDPEDFTDHIVAIMTGHAPDPEPQREPDYLEAVCEHGFTSACPLNCN